jgi:GT2 family glycosyltransferase
MTALPSKWPRIFVLTLNWNGKKWLGDCLDAILSMDYPNFETVVIDNGSTDGSVDYLQASYPFVHIIENHANLGYAHGFNKGLEYAFSQRGADFCLVMNNDTKIHKGALSALVKSALEMERAGFVTGKVYIHDRPDILQTVGHVDRSKIFCANDIGAGERDCGQHDSAVERAFMDDVFTLVCRQMYEDVGGYDPQFFLQCEELDWQWRAKKKGWRLYYTPHAKLWHYGSLSSGGGNGNATTLYFLRRNEILVMTLHAGLHKGIIFLVASTYNQARQIIAGFVKGGLGHKARIAGLLGTLAGVIWLLHRRPAKKIPGLVQWLAR